MMLELLFLLQQAILVPDTGSLTPAMRTEPIEELDCRIIGRSGSAFRVVFRREGMQGYYYTSNILPNERQVGRTNASYRIVEDETGRLNSMNFSGYGNLRRIGPTFADKTGNSVVFRPDTDDKSNEASLTYYIYASGAGEPEVFSGPYEVTRIAQSPLDNAPRSE